MLSSIVCQLEKVRKTIKLLSDNISTLMRHVKRRIIMTKFIIQVINKLKECSIKNSKIQKYTLKYIKYVLYTALCENSAVAYKCLALKEFQGQISFSKWSPYIVDMIND